MLGHSTAGVGDPSLHWGVGVQDMGVQHGGMRVGGGGTGRDSLPVPPEAQAPRPWAGGTGSDLLPQRASSQQPPR